MPITTFLDGRPPMRGLLWVSLSDTLILESRTAVSDAGGGGSATWVSSGTVPCRIQPLSRRPTDRTTGGVIDERSTHVIEAPPDTAVQSGQRAVVSGRGTFEVTGVHQRTRQFTQVFEVIALL